jgi:hypothetical protein
MGLRQSAARLLAASVRFLDGDDERSPAPSSSALTAKTLSRAGMKVLLSI